MVREEGLEVRTRMSRRTKMIEIKIKLGNKVYTGKIPARKRKFFLTFVRLFGSLSEKTVRQDKDRRFYEILESGTEDNGDGF